MSLILALFVVLCLFENKAEWSRIKISLLSTREEWAVYCRHKMGVSVREYVFYVFLDFKKHDFLRFLK